MATDKKQLMKTIAEEWKTSDMDAEDKLRGLAPLLALCDRNLSELDFRVWLDTYGIETIDPVIEALARGYMNLLHYSGIITIQERMADTWLNVDDEGALQGVTDEQLAEFISELEMDIIGMEAYIG